MDIGFMDRFSLLHFAVGIVAYFFSVDWKVWFIAHSIFEIVENTKMGVHFINTYIKIWPGGKEKPDLVINSVGDTFFAMLGWLAASIVST